MGDALEIARPVGHKRPRPLIEPGLVNEYHRALMEHTGPIRDIIRDRRGLVDSTLAKFQIGYDGDRVTIPVYDEFNTLVNIRRYKWNSTDNKFKVLNYTDEAGNKYGEVRIYGLEQVLDTNVKSIVWCGGEMDRLVAEQHGFPTACATAGEGTWKPEWTRLFRGKTVYLCQDNDEAGRSANRRLCSKLYRVANVYTVQWPEGFIDKGDITDYFVGCNGTAEGFQALLDNAVKYVDEELQEQRLVDDGEAIEVHLADSGNAELYKKRIHVPVMVSGKDTTPYVCPKRVHAHCGEAADMGQKRCQQCALALAGGDITKTYGVQDALLLKLIKCTDSQQRSTICADIGVNVKCPYFSVDYEEYMNLEELRLIPKADANFGFTKEREYVVRTGYIVDAALKSNKRYMMAGYMVSDPLTQYATYLFDKAYPEKDLVSDFEVTDEVINYLKLFQLGPGQSVSEKFYEIHRDLERNVTFIWDRKPIAYAVDLVYHTVLNFKFQEQAVKRGWGEALIIGDSGQAKTTVVERLMQHYRLGEMHSGESSRRTGLIYNIQQNSRRWFLVWGAFPLNDGGLVTLDELSGLDEDDLAKMSDVRSSGVARSTGVITAETMCRTRAIYISNPRNGRQLNSETYGASHILRLFGKAEDVRRLDIAIAAASGDIDPRLMNTAIKDIPDIPHVYVSDACNARVLWAWSRTTDQVVFTDEATREILDAATEMGTKYSPKVPLVEAADQRIKLARLSVAAAACVASTDETFQKIIVQPSHVRFVVKFLNEQYSTKAMGYDRMSDFESATSDVSTDNINKLKTIFLQLPLNDPAEIARIIYTLPYFSRNTLADYTGLTADDLRLLMKFMTTNSLVEHTSKQDYRRMPLGTEFFKVLTTHGISQEDIKKARAAYHPALGY